LNEDVRQERALRAAARSVSVTRKLEQDACKLVSRRNVIDGRRGDCRARHSVEAGRVGILYEHQSAGRVQPFHAARAIRAAARENHRDGAMTAVLGERGEEAIDGKRKPHVRIAIEDLERAVPDLELFSRLQEVHVVGFGLDAGRRPTNREIGEPRHQLVHDTLKVWREVLDDDERGAGLRRQCAKQLLQRLQSSGGGADAHDRELCRLRICRRFCRCCRRFRCVDHLA
jgi:hypothetical protein